MTSCHHDIIRVFQSGSPRATENIIQWFHMCNNVKLKWILNVNVFILLGHTCFDGDQYCISWFHNTILVCFQIFSELFIQMCE